MGLTRTIAAKSHHVVGKPLSSARRACWSPGERRIPFPTMTCIPFPVSHNTCVTQTQKKRGRQLDANSTSGKIRELLKTDMSVGDIAKKLGCTPALVYNVKARAAGGGAKKRGPGRPPKAKTPAGQSFDGLAGILEAVQGGERERARLRAALEKIQAVLADALA